jgi:uncharacterized membrane protein (DUF106 family)
MFIITEKKKLFNAPETAATTLEALQQRLDKYKSSHAEAKEENNSSKARRMNRIVKVHLQAFSNRLNLLFFNI